MFSDSDDALTGIEKRMLDALDVEYARWEESDNPLPVSLVQLLERTHRTILARLGKRGGFNMNEMAKNPGAALVQVKKIEAMLLRMVSQQDSSNTQVVRSVS